MTKTSQSTPCSRLGSLEAEADRIIADEVEKEHRSFVPHISADYESLGPSRRRPDESFKGTPTPVIPIPTEIAGLPFEQQIHLLKPLIQDHYARYGDLITEQNERIEGFRGWLSLSDWNEVNFHLFSCEGDYLPDEPSPIPKPKPPRRSRRAKRHNTLKQGKRR